MTDEYFRFVRGSSPTTDDFKSQGALGGRMRFPGGKKLQRQWTEGISIYDDLSTAYEVAAAGGFAHGSYIAKIVLPRDHDLEIEQTGKNVHHYTIYAKPEVLLALVSGTPFRIPGAPIHKD